MKIDDLISKYIDGELTPEEDIILRKRLSEDKNAKFDFDTDINLHYAIKNEAKNIEIPISFIQNVEDKILMKILANAPIFDEKPIYSINYFKKSILVAALLIFTLFNISDLKIENLIKSNQISSINNLPNQEFNSLDENKSHSYIDNKNIVNNLDFSIDEKLINVDLNQYVPTVNLNSDLGFNAENDKIINNSQNLAMNNTLINNYFENNSFDNQIQKINSINNLLSSNLILNFNEFNNPVLSKSSNIDFNSLKNEVILSSLIQNDFLGNENNFENIKKISSFTQSIGYSIDQLNYVGFEIGTTQYSFNEKIDIYLPTNKIDVKIEENNNNSDYIKIQVDKLKTNQFLWGSLFYDNKLFSYDEISLNSRIGVGASNNGLISFGRIYLNYNIFNNLNLVIGAEDKIFQHKQTINNSSKVIWKNYGSLVYGIQFKL